MIEQAMYFLLGAMTAALLAMAALPAIWRRAVRLTRARLEATLPLTPAEIAAEKDQIRAEFVVDRRRLEQRIEAADASVQTLKAQTGTQLAALQDNAVALNAHAERISALEGELRDALQTIDARDGTIATLTRERDNVSTLLTAARIANQGLEQDAQGVRALASQQQARLAEIEQQHEGLNIRLGELQALNDDLRETLRQRSDELRAAARDQRDAASAQAVLERRFLAADSMAQDRAAAIEALQSERLRLIDELGQITRERDATRRDLIEAERDGTAARARIAEQEAAFARERSELQATAVDLTKSMEQMRLERRTMSEEISSLRFTKSRLETDLARYRRKEVAEPSLGLPDADA